MAAGTRTNRLAATEAMNRLRQRHQLESTAIAEYASAAAHAGDARQAAEQAEMGRVTALAAFASLIGSETHAAELAETSVADIRAAVKAVPAGAVDAQLNGWRRTADVTGRGPGRNGDTATSSGATAPA